MLKLKAYAKINLSLKILGLRPDGYHELESVMQSVTLFDTLTLTPIDSGIEVVTTNLQLPTNNKNLAYKAAEVFEGSVGNRGKMRDGGIKIYIEKNIPLGAGLAGGSADAAAVLVGLNNIYGKKLSQEELMVLGARIGSDVPFCVMGGNCTVKGRGERVLRNVLSVTRNYLLVIPDVEVSTKWAYNEFDRITHYPLPITDSKNDLESVVIKKYPVIQKVKERMLGLGCTFAQMSGSGSSVFGFPASQAMANDMAKEYSRSFYVETAPCGVAVSLLE